MDALEAVTELVGPALAQCRAAAAAHAPTLGVLFATGLVGSGTHCAGMCGPFALGFAAARLQTEKVDRWGEWRRIGGAALLGYHAGRITTYAALGTAAAGIVGGIGMWGGARFLSAGLLAVAALAFFAATIGALARLGSGGFWAGRRWGEILSAIAAPLTRAPYGWRLYALGVTLGFLPCGLIYAAVAAASSTASPLAAALGMAAFGLGTAPALVAIAWTGTLIGQRWRSVTTAIAPAVLAANAVLLAILAGQAVMYNE